MDVDDQVFHRDVVLVFKQAGVVLVSDIKYQDMDFLLSLPDFQQLLFAFKKFLIFREHSHYEELDYEHMEKLTNRLDQQWDMVYADKNKEWAFDLLNREIRAIQIQINAATVTENYIAHIVAFRKFLLKRSCRFYLLQSTNDLSNYGSLSMSTNLLDMGFRDSILRLQKLRCTYHFLENGTLTFDILNCLFSAEKTRGSTSIDAIFKKLGCFLSRLLQEEHSNLLQKAQNKIALKMIETMQVYFRQKEAGVAISLDDIFVRSANEDFNGNDFHSTFRRIVKLLNIRISLNTRKAQHERNMQLLQKHAIALKNMTTRIDVRMALLKHQAEKLTKTLNSLNTMSLSAQIPLKTDMSFPKVKTNDATRLWAGDAETSLTGVRAELNKRVDSLIATQQQWNNRIWELCSAFDEKGQFRTIGDQEGTFQRFRMLFRDHREDIVMPETMKEVRREIKVDPVARFIRDVAPSSIVQPAEFQRKAEYAIHKLDYDASFSVMNNTTMTS